jgi:hypothetical protein
MMPPAVLIAPVDEPGGVGHDREEDPVRRACRPAGAVRRGLGQRHHCHHLAYGRAAAWPGLSPAGVFWGCPCRVH